MLSVKVEDYGETEDQMHYVTYRASGLSEKELDFLLNEIEMTYFIASFLEDMK